MAIELSTENSNRGVSPRISFSHDLCQFDIVPVEQLPWKSRSSSVDFDFGTRLSSDQESSADELFSDGKILPIEIKPKITPGKYQDDASIISLPKAAEIEPKPESLEEIKSCDYNEKQKIKSSWKFRRSISLNCGSGYARSLCPLPLMSRSNSTGSTSNVKRSALSSKDIQKNLQKQNASKASKVVQSSSSLSSGSYQKPPVMISGNNRNRIRVNPVLNVHPAANLFGFGSIFNQNKNKKK